MMGLNKLYILVRKAQSGNEEATVKLVSTFKPKVKKEIRIISSFFNREDLEQELIIQIIKAVRRFDIDSTPNFDEFLKSLKKNKNN
jgi:DNA-directed RNA polymerase specialized sigma subunit